MTYKIVQWASGSVGTASLKEIIRHPDLELVGLRVFNPDKVGEDAGVLAGGDPIGVTATDSIDDILAIDCDVIIHTPRASGHLDEMYDDMERLLRAGKNIITVAIGIAPERHGPDFARRFEAACKAGGSTLHGTGIDPGFLCDRLPATLTALSSEVDHIRMLEAADLRYHPNPEMMMGLLGFGMKPEEFTIDPTNPGLVYCTVLLPEAVYALFDLLQVPFGRLEIDPPTVAFATHDLDLPSGVVNKGTVAGITWMFKGYRPEDPDDKPYVTHQWSWYVEPNLPNMPESDGRYQIRLDIEGRPTLRTVVDITDQEDAIFFPTAIAAIRAIPEVAKAGPGILMSTVFAPWTPRMP
jgi:hypothetical protein